ncbi:glycoside hydrolase family 9 protein [Chengkuizengella sp. SCS-71B]|uniref:glycoside hydrolase family 9 protein n=1 Tax=Chengkuizengella sp. SCS-71B TaxID=3115290 RepID=UPI0032C21DEA
MIKFTHSKLKLYFLIFILLFTPISNVLIVDEAAAAPSSFNYAEVLQKSILFYEAQRSGDLPENNRVNWRGDSGLEDGSDVGLDLTGGWYDAGDHVKFGFPMAASTTMLAWSVYEYREAYEQTNQLDEILDNIKWVTDYFIKAHPEPNVLYGQVGNGGLDHAYWGPAETMQMARPAYKIDASCPGSDLAGETAAAMAAASIIFKPTDPDYAATLLTHAEQLFNFADQYRGVYSDCIQDAQGYYNSWSGYADELTWMGIWMYLATNDEYYLTYAENSTADWGKENHGNSPYWSYKWGQAWDDKHYGAQLLLAKITDKPIYKESTERNLDFWTTGVPETGEQITYTPGGLAWLDQWGALRYSANNAFLAFVYSDWLMNTDAVKAQKYQDFAVSQVTYMLGDNPDNRSYVIGFGNNPPINAHHRGAHSSYEGSIQRPVDNRHILVGALVGGPGNNDLYEDNRENYVNNEVATDYNAGFTGAIAKMYLLYGGTPLDNFPQPQLPTEDQLFVEASYRSYTPNSMQVISHINNRSGWPSIVGNQLSFKYFIDISEVVDAGYDVSDVTVELGTNGGAVISPLIQWEDNVYYVTIDFTGTEIYPGDINQYRKSAYFSFEVPDGVVWDPSNDWSYQSLSNGAEEKTIYIPVYNAGVLVGGQEPSGGVILPPTIPTGLTANADDGVIGLSWSSVIGADSYNLKRSATSGGPYTTIGNNLTNTNYSDTGLTNGSTYYYVVSAVNDTGESANSSEVSAIPNPPPAPGSFTLTAEAGNGNVDLSWTISSNAISYDVKRSETQSGPFTSIASALTANTYNDTNVVNGTTYYYVITANNSSGSTDSNTVSAAPQLPLPGSFTLNTQASNETVNLSWSVSSFADSYSVGRSTSSNGSYTTIATGLTSTAYSDTGLTNGITYYYVVTAENGSGTTDSNTVSATPQLPSDLKLQYKAADTNATDNQFKPHFNMVNTGNSSVPLSELTIRYYYTADGSQSFEFHCDYAVVGCGNVSGAHVQMSNPAENADHYLEISFSAGAGNLAAGGQSGEIQARNNKSDWSNLNELNDYSYNGNLTDFTEWNQVTLYQNGALISGVEPGGSGGGNPTPPAAPTGLTASAGAGQVDLSWSGVSGADSYNVKRSTSAGGTYTTVATGVTSTNYTNAGLTNGTTYYYVVSAQNTAGESADSTEASATPQSSVTIPGSPTGLTASAGDGQVDLSWSSVSGADSYNVKRSTSAGGTYTTVATGVTSTNYTNAGLTNGTTYYYVVSAQNTAGESADSTEASATPQSSVTIPGSPTGLTASAGNGQVDLSWSSVSGADSYNVKRSTSAGGTYTTVATGITSTNYTNAGLTNGTTYYYVVSAQNTAGESANSTEASATPQSSVTIPGSPTGLTASAGDGQVDLSWSGVSGADSYNVKRSTSAGGTYTTVATGITSINFTNAGLTNGTTYYYVVSAQNTAGESANSTEASATPSGGGTASDLVVQYKAADTNATDNQFKPHFNIVNNGNTDVALNELTIRYYYTIDGNQTQQFHCDYAVVGCGNVNGTHVAMSQSTADADHYIELNFTAGAGTLAAGGQSGEIQTRNNKTNWSNYNENNDYSFNASMTAFTDWNKVTLHQNGQLVWGSEPTGSGNGGEPDVPGAFSLSTPTNGANNISLTPTFSWGSSTDVSFYTLEVADNISYNNPVISVNNLTQNNYVSEVTLAENTTYYWRVIAQNDQGTTEATNNNISFTTRENILPSGFVSTSGTEFMLDGKPFYYAGTNNYYLMYKSNKMIDDVLEDANNMGLKVIRTWGFMDGNGQEGIVMQPELGVYNEDGFDRFDYAVYKAKELNIKLIVPLVNYWSDFGGMEQYQQWLGLSNKTDFYTNPDAITAYKNYISHFLNRVNPYTGVKYINEPTIMAWELGNEPRNPDDKSGDTLVNWADEISTFIKSIDSNHLVATGDEGFYNDPNSSDYTRSGYEGVDWERLTALPNIDYGTVHMYPDHWGTAGNAEEWGNIWISDHIQDAHEIGKPVIFEEFGLTNEGTRDTIYESWLNTIYAEGGNGSNFWILTGIQDDDSLYPNYDGFRVVFPSDTATLFSNHAALMNEKSEQEDQPGITTTFETNTIEGWEPRMGVETLNVTSDDAKNGTYSLLITDRQDPFGGAKLNVLEKMDTGSNYNVSVWVKLAPNENTSNIRVSLERSYQGSTNYYTIVGNTTVTNNGWVLLEAEYTMQNEADSLFIYVESDSGLASFYIDDFELSYIPSLPPLPIEQDIPSLHEVLQDDFLMGAAIEPYQTQGLHSELLQKHFKTITAENVMKPNSMQPTEGNFNFTEADILIDYAKENEMLVRGHTLIWHNQTADWFFKDAEGNDMEPTPENKQLLLERLETHVRTVVEHFKGDVFAWDVVNEVIDPGQPNGLRNSKWYQITGTDYIKRAFEVAHETDPNAKLYINDYSTTNPTKRQYLYELVTELINEGVPIDGVGHQLHVNIEYPSPSLIEDTIVLFSSLGMDNQITELDMSIYNNNTDQYEVVPEEVIINQGYRYKEIFDVFKKHSDDISSVTTWGLADDHTWLSTFPITRINLPLLFDKQLQSKPAYWGIVDPSKLPVLD